MSDQKESYIARIATRLMDGRSCITYPAVDVATARVMSCLTEDQVNYRFLLNRKKELRSLRIRRRAVVRKLKEMEQNA